MADIVVPFVVAHDNHEERWALKINDDGCRLLLRSPAGQELAASGNDLWDSLRDLRLKLEPLGLLACCNGARVNAHPSHMGLEMGGGGGAYLLKLRHPVRSRRRLVDVLSYASSKHVGTVAAQDEFYERWLGSLK